MAQLAATRSVARNWVRAAAALTLLVVLANAYADLQPSAISDNVKISHTLSVSDINQDIEDAEKFSPTGRAFPKLTEISSSGRLVSSDVRFGSHIRPPDGRPPNFL